MILTQCMGGWCKQRDKCQHFIAKPIQNRMPVERLCGPTEEPEPLKEPKNAQQTS